jgi:small subunit ribosomal protein S18
MSEEIKELENENIEENKNDVTEIADNDFVEVDDKDEVQDKDEVVADKKDEVEDKDEVVADKKDDDEEAEDKGSGNRGSGRPQRGQHRGGGKKFFYTKKVCKFCTNQIEESAIDYKNVDMLRRFVMPSGKIVPRRITGSCAKHQRMLSKEIKRARILAFLPFLDR